MKRVISWAMAVALLFTAVLTLFGCANQGSGGNSTEISTESNQIEAESQPMITISDRADYANVALGKRYSKSVLYPDNVSPTYPDENNKTMTDGVITPEGAKFSHPSFIGFNKYSFNYANNGYSSITVNLGGNYLVDKFVAHVASKYYYDAGITAPEFAWIYVSNDNKNWYKVGKTSHTDTDESNTVASVLELEYAISAKYIQYRFVGDSNWILVCEVEAYGVESDETVIPEQDEEIKFLFVGNSSTYYFNIPIRFIELAEAAGKKIDVTYCCAGDSHLTQWADDTLVNHGQVLKAKLLEKKYDYVVLQDHSSTDFNKSKAAIDIIKPLIEQNGAEMVLYMRYSSSDDINQRIASAYRHYQNYTSLAKEFNVSKVAPAAEAFLIVNQRYPEINLYHTDNSHHSNVGSYLIACVWAITYLGIDVTDVPYYASLDIETATKLKECAKLACEVGYDFPQEN